MTNTIYLRPYEDTDKEQVIGFLEACFPESGKNFFLYPSYEDLFHIPEVFEYFLCAYDRETKKLIGTCAYKPMDEKKCELKCVYLFKAYHGQGLGTKMCKQVMSHARDRGYQEMCLETIRENSPKAIKMYERLGFIEVEKYNQNIKSDLYMKCTLTDMV